MASILGIESGLRDIKYLPRAARVISKLVAEGFTVKTGNNEAPLTPQSTLISRCHIPNMDRKDHEDSYQRVILAFLAAIEQVYKGPDWLVNYVEKSQGRGSSILVEKLIADYLGSEWPWAQQQFIGRNWPNHKMVFDNFRVLSMPLTRSIAAWLNDVGGVIHLTPESGRVWLKGREALAFLHSNPNARITGLKGNLYPVFGYSYFGGSGISKDLYPNFPVTNITYDDKGGPTPRGRFGVHYVDKTVNWHDYHSVEEAQITTADEPIII